MDFMNYVNFALVLFILLVLTALIWLVDVLWLRKRRDRDAPDPWWIEYGASFFPVILVVFILRSFIIEPFKIPSESMLPTLLVGDFILVNKLSYGIRLPVLNTKIWDTGSPNRGDVMVFRYPEDPSMNFIKRVIALPGDKVEYQNKRLTINGQPVPEQAEADYLHPATVHYSRQFSERLGNVEHRFLNDDDKPGFIVGVANFPDSEYCTYNNAGVICTVPPGRYFVLGDNRDNSRDSRYWGFVPEENIVGRAFFIWFNFSDLSRIGSFR